MNQGDQGSSGQEVWPRIPVIVLNWNGLEDTRECLHALLSMDYPSFMIVLLDNASDNSEGLILQEEYGELKNVSLHLFDENLGFAGAHNRIVPNLVDEGYNYIALLNNDTVVDKNWLRELVRVAEKEGADMVSSKLIDYYDRRNLDNVGHQMLTTGEIVPIGFREDPDQYEGVLENFGSCAGATLYRSSMISTIGFFDSYFSTGYEDAEFGARAVITGHRAVLASLARVYHKISRSVSKVKTDEYELMIRNAIWYSYLKLVTRPLVRRSLFAICIKQIIILTLHLITFDLRSFRLTCQSLRYLLKCAMSGEERWIDQWSGAGNTSLSHKELRGRQTPFFLHDVRRFAQVFLYSRH